MLFWLALVALGVAVVALRFQLGLSLLWGVAVSALPGFCFAWLGYPNAVGARQAAASLKALYRAERIKFVITAILFAAVFSQAEQLHLGAFFTAYLVTHLGSTLVVAKRLVRPKLD